MTRSKTRRTRDRRTGTLRRELAIVMAVSMVLTIQPWPLIAQQALDCSVNGFCLSPNLTNLLGLPNGTLKIVGYQPWDQVVKGPAAAVWGPLEAEARATLAALHGVPNDNRLPQAALDELRSWMFLRLVSIARKKALGQEALTGVERDALDMFSQLVVDRRVRAAQKALDEYARWQSNPCGYAVPAGFGFDQYAPGPQCGVGGVMLSGPPRPPTKEQFTAYGSALAMKEAEDQIRQAKRAALGIEESDTTFFYDPSADRDAALRDADEALGIAVGVAGAALVSGVTLIAATASTSVALTLATIAGSSAPFITPAAGITALGWGTSAVTVGLGVAAVPAMLIASIVVAVIYIIQFAEDQSILPMLQESLEESRQPPDMWALASSQEPLNRAELFATFMYQTLPSYDTERAATIVPPVPDGRQPGDPQFEVNGAVQDVVETLDSEAKLQQTFMSQGWFVTRRQVSTGVWGPWLWSLTLRYRGANLSDMSPQTAGIQPAGFFFVPSSVAGSTAVATKVTELQTLSPAFQTQIVKWKGNRAPRIVPAVAGQPVISTAATFNAAVTDPDGNRITAIRWFFEDPTQVPLRPSLAECSLDPPGQIDPVSTLPYACPWVPRDDFLPEGSASSTGVSFTYARPGTWAVLVMAKDDEGAVSSERFSVTVGNLAPTLVINRYPFTVLPPQVASTPEGEQVSISGTIHYPALPDGSYAALTFLVVDWGDGTGTVRAYPCSDRPWIPADGNRTCLAFATEGGVVGLGPSVYKDPLGPLPDGPWSFSFSHKYAYGPNRFANPAQIKVYAVTTLDGRTQTERIDANVTNVPPLLQMAFVCPLVQTPNESGVQCIGGDFREAAAGQPLAIRGRIVDIPEATHLVKVLWGDGTSSALIPGCSDAGCPGTGQPWLGASTATAYPPKYMSLSHTYQTVGTYPVTIVVDDGGPNGEVSHATQATIFGLSPIGGPTEVDAGAEALYTYRSVFPAGATAAVTPTCQGGQVTAQTSSSFTCRFDDVAARTASRVKLQSEVAGTPFERTLDVDVLPRPTSVSPLSGPVAVTEGTTAVYTYSVTHSPFGLVLFGRSCGASGTVVMSVGGESVTCRFHEVSQPTATMVNVTVSAGGSTDSSDLEVIVQPDATPPALALPATIALNSTSNAGAAVTYNVSAEDAISGAAPVTCSHASGAQFPIGTTTVSCSAKDWKQNETTGAFQVIVTDVTPPSLSLPASQVLDATAPSGAVATFTATASDAIPIAPAVSCLPSTGSTFPIGTTTVGCSATDAAGNAASGQFTITVQGPLAQVRALQEYVAALTAEVTIKDGLAALLRSAETAVAADRPSACSQLAAVAKQVTEARGSRLSVEQADRILGDVTRIRAVLGC